MRILGSSIRFIDAVIIVNILVFIAGLANVPSECGEAITWVGCEFGLIPFLAASEPWRIITSMFVHGGLNHLFMNTVALYFFGRYIGEILSERRIIAIYFLGGLAGSLMYLLFAFIGLDAPMNAVVVGASGALFALGGAIAVLRPHLQVMIFPFPIPMDMWKAEILIFLFVSFFPNVAWQGHLGGLLAGALLGYYYKKKTLKPTESVYFTTRYY